MSNAKAPRRLQIGQVWIDALTFAEAIDAIDALVRDRRGGAVFTPNIDHVVNAETDPEFRAAYSRAALSLVDGQPLVWVSPLLGVRLPEKISGSDLIAPLMERAGERGWGVYLLGGAPGVGARAAEILTTRYRVKVVGHASPVVGPRGECDPAVLDAIRATSPDLVLVAFGSPKQELFIDSHAAQLQPAVSLAIGAGLDFIAGAVRRAPPWMSSAGLEWLYRLSREPRRLWRRYLVNDPKFAWILLRSLRSARQ